MKDNQFTSDLVDVVLAKEVAEPIEMCNGIFIILELWPSDIRKVIKNERMEIDHVKILIYNCLCATNFLHSTGIIHRDLKSANILIDSKCQVAFCDFGLARVMPETDKQGKK